MGKHDQILFVHVSNIEGFDMLYQVLTTTSRTSLNFMIAVRRVILV